MKKNIKAKLVHKETHDLVFDIDFSVWVPDIVKTDDIVENATLFAIMWMYINQLQTDQDFSNLFTDSLATSTYAIEKDNSDFLLDAQRNIDIMRNEMEKEFNIYINITDENN